MPQLIQHIPIERDGVPTPQTLAPILKAAKPGTVTLVAANARDDSPITQTLLSLSLDIAKTTPTTFASLQYDEASITARLYAAALGADSREYFRKSRNNAFRRPELEALQAASEARLDFVFNPLLGSAFPPSPGGALIIDYAQCLLGTHPAEWMRGTAKKSNVAVIAGFYLSVYPDAPNALIPGIKSYERTFARNADNVFVLHAEGRR